MSIKPIFKYSGFDQYLRKVEQAGNDVISVAAEAVEVGARVITKKGLGSRGNEGIEGWAARHRKTGATIGGVIKPKAVIEGNFVFAEAGISGAGDSMDAVYVEYGRPGVPADPGIRRAFEQNKALALKMEKMVLENKGGTPIG